MPFSLLLQQFGNHVWHAFGYMSYHVGSSLADKHGWRDVDVRLLLPDDEYARMKLGDPARQQQNERWVSLVLAWSAFGKSLTGLPIDFQIQQQTYANATEKGKPRSALFLVHEVIDETTRPQQDERQRDLSRVANQPLTETAELPQRPTEDVRTIAPEKTRE